MVIIMSEKRGTKRDNFEAIKAILVERGEDALVAVMEHEIELVSKKRNAPTKAQKANVELVEKVYNILAASDVAMTATEIFNVATAEGIEGITSNQKVSALLKMLGDRIVKETNGKKSTFKVADAE